MELLRATGIEKSFANRQILRGCDLAIQTGERVGLVGINGSGKTTLLRALCGEEEPDHGQIWRRPASGGVGGLGYLAQDPPIPGDTVGASLQLAVGWHAELSTAWEAALAAEDTVATAHFQDLLDVHGWELGHRVDAIADRLGLPARNAAVARLSGGERRRLALARVLLGAPDLLLLDEPTNHLDADTIEWLQDWLLGWKGALILVTHDRYLLEALATRVVEVEDGITVSYDGAYADYLIGRAERQASLHKAEDRRLAMITREAEWASRSPAAQTVKQKARLQRLDALLAQRPLKREETFTLDFSTGFKKGGPLVELHGVTRRFGPRTLIEKLELVLRPGERVGVLGPNGVGKSTLLHLVAGTQRPDKGEIVRAPRLNPAFLDQGRTGLKPDDTVYEAAGGGNDHVRIGDRDVHVTSFLGRFLFTRQHFDQRVSALSGGERARLLIARLLLRGANLLLLDEPTNDLDLLTLEVLEESLLSFDGAVLIVSHDRAFLDRVCTNVIVFEETGQIGAYASRPQANAARDRRRAEAARAEAARQEAARARAEPAKAPPPRKATLSFKELQEHSNLPGQIEQWEAQIAALNQRLTDPAVWKAGGDGSALTAQAAALTAQVEAAYARWTELEEKSARR
jgi:ATP-binding cassette subfamily F protein uup